MIYTVTLNPALDKTVEIPNFSPCAVNRITALRTDPGGKGINVSKSVKAIGGDTIAMGVLGGESGIYRNALERMFFPALQYTDPPSTLARKKVDFAFVFTMNVPRDLMDEYKYAETLGKTFEFPVLVYNSAPPEVLYVCDTFQFSDYSLYESGMFDADAKKEARQKLFPQDLQKAYELGKKLALS